MNSLLREPLADPRSQPELYVRQHWRHMKTTDMAAAMGTTSYRVERIRENAMLYSRYRTKVKWGIKGRKAEWAGF